MKDPKPRYKPRTYLGDNSPSSAIVTSDLNLPSVPTRKHGWKDVLETREEYVRQEKRHKRERAIRSGSKSLGRGKKRRSMVGMVRGKGYRKRPYEKIEQWMNNEISFPSVPRCRLVKSPIILEAFIKGFHVHKIYVDGGSSLEVMYEHCFRNLGPKTRAKLRESKVSLVGFSWEVNYPLGMAEQDIPPPTITAMKIPIIRKGEYDIWSMRMRQYICHTDHNLWDVIVNGDLEEEPAPTTGETSAPPAPKTAKQLAARRNQERVKSILLLAIPDEYLLKFHNVADAKSL
ncbi:hypothetical protein Tco_0989442 [Tanacetum coccineum]|uniref:Uncharacterized protein n=1 Tax=Tanacetum coccineum TaxID=301880 RepID=A0ABQ5ETN1_9ASTR